MKRIFVAGHRGMVGSAIVRQLRSLGDVNVLTQSRKDLDLKNQQNVAEFFASHDIDEVIIAAAKVGGIHANSTYPADFIYDNLQIQNNIIHHSHLSGIQKLLFLGSTCIYPKHANQPIKEEELLTGSLEPTNEPYAIAKIAGIKMCESYNRQYGRDYRSVMPTNLYGPGDNFHPKDSHVMPALITRIHKAKVNNLKEVSIWGTGNPRREFLFVEDMAEAALYIHNLDIDKYQSITEASLSHINVGSGKDISIKELAEIICEVIGYHGELTFDLSKPDGTMQKLSSCEKLSHLGWKFNKPLLEGIKETYMWYLDNKI